MIIKMISILLYCNSKYKNYALRIFLTLNYHTSCFYVTDIKPENLLISKNNVLKLCDFGKYCGLFGLVYNKYMYAYIMI